MSAVRSVLPKASNSYLRSLQVKNEVVIFKIDHDLFLLNSYLLTSPVFHFSRHYVISCTETLLRHLSINQLKRSVLPLNYFFMA